MNIEALRKDQKAKISSKSHSQDELETGFIDSNKLFLSIPQVIEPFDIPTEPARKPACNGKVVEPETPNFIPVDSQDDCSNEPKVLKRRKLEDE